MVESYRVDKQGYEIKLSVTDEELSSLAKKVGGKMAAGEKYDVIDSFSMLPRISSPLSIPDLESGSFNLLDKTKDQKIFFYKTVPAEQEKTNALKQLGIKELIDYSGSLKIGDNDFYLFGRLPASAVNLNFFMLCDLEQTEFFGTFDVLKQSADILARIHAQGFAHNNFKVEQMIMISNGNQGPLVLYGNGGVEKTDSTDERTKDIADFIASLKKNNPKCYKDDYGRYFENSYFEVLKNGNGK